MPAPALALALQPRLLGSVIVAMIEKSKQTVGLQLSYIELSSIAVTIVGGSVLCVIVHDRADGEEFGRLLAGETLAAFMASHARELAAGKGGAVAHSSFQDFQFRLGQVIRDTARPVLEQLKRNRAVVLALLVREDTGHARAGDSSIVHATGEVDQFGVLANLKPLTSAASDVMALRSDAVQSVWLESSPTRASRLLVHRVAPSTFLIVQFSKRFDFAHYREDVARATRLLEKVSVHADMVTKR